MCELTPYLRKQIRKRLDTLNWLYGKGDIEHICFITFTVKRTTRDVRKFRIEDDTVYFLGRQRKLC
jgi:hypothetical protein